MKNLLLITVLSAFCLSTLTGCLFIAKNECKCCQHKESHAQLVKPDGKHEARPEARPETREHRPTAAPNGKHP